MSGRGPSIGCIADDFTGAVDVASGVANVGLDPVIVTSRDLGDLARSADVVIVALQTRNMAADTAVQESIRAAQQLRNIGVGQLFFKYCSTFDSTSKGNIGPVADALIELMGQQVAVVVPGYPSTGRTVRGGRLYVDGTLLSESAMRNHPITPMTCSSVPRLLGAQSRFTVGLVEEPVIRAGSAAITTALDELGDRGNRYAVLDTESEQDIHNIARAVRFHELATGGAALMNGLAQLIADSRRHPPQRRSGSSLPKGRRIVLSGSCSVATQAQVCHFAKIGPTMHWDPRQIDDPERCAAQALAWAATHDADRPVLISTTADSATLHSIQKELGADAAAARTESFFRSIAKRLVQSDFNRILVAGGDTSGTVTYGLGIAEMTVGERIGPGLAWCTSRTPPIALALKSGNFGSDDVFMRAHRILDEAFSKAGSPGGCS